MRRGAGQEKLCILRVVQPPDKGFPARCILNFIEEKELLAVNKLGVKLGVSAQDQIQFTGLDGHQAIVLEIEEDHLAAIHAAGFEPAHGVVEDIGLAATSNA